MCLMFIHFPWAKGPKVRNAFWDPPEMRWRKACDTDGGYHHFIWIQATIISWLVVWNHGILWLPIYWEESSSQLTNSIIFQRGRAKNHHFICRLSTSTGDKRREITKLETSRHAMPRAIPISELTQGLSQQHQSLGKFDACGRSAGCCLCCLEDLWYRWVKWVTHEKTTYGDGSKAMNSHILLGYNGYNIHLPAIK